MKKASVLMVLALLVALGVHVTTAQEGTGIGTFEETDCFFTLFSGAPIPEDVVCGYITVPEEHSNPEGNTLRLAVTILPATGDANGAPLFMAQGGPGGSSIDAFAAFELVLNTDFAETVQTDRDIVLVDQRGTLYSEPFLRCVENNDLIYENIGLELEYEEALALADEASAACYDRLQSEGVNLSAYDSIENANDMNMVRQALGYDQIVFYGVSYGTLLAQHYMRLFPETLESVILDAVVPTSIDFFTATPNNALRSFKLLFESCANDANCSANYGDLEALFYDTVEALNAEPVTFTTNDLLNTGENYDVVFNGDALAGMVFQLLYSQEVIPLLPALIDQVANEDYAALSFFVGVLYFDFSIADAMYLSVVCAEETDTMVEPMELPDALVRALDVTSLDADCAAWAVDPLAPEVDDPVVSDIPTLVMSGEFDPITPPSNGDVVARTLSNAYVYTFPGAGHGAVNTPCGANITAQFIADPTTEPDSSCIADMGISFQ